MKSKEQVRMLTLLRLEELQSLKQGQIVLLANAGWWVLGTFDSLDNGGINIRGNKGIHWSDLTKMDALYLFVDGTLQERIIAAKEHLFNLILEKNLIYW